ncbi:MAG TPA: DoxX family protein [Candidatus Omnitrophota bacterium]|nr:DoxX family protein [Candidatus Omnitrophota bacterium]HPS37396.1 DoxX family protein [Candidatus Omnitrophota bacterium]
MQEKSYKILFLGRMFLGLVFAYSGYTKLMEPVENFQGAMAAYEIIPYGVIPLLARIIPWIEFVFGVFLLVGYMPRVSAAVLAMMSWSFVLLILATRFMTGALPADCGCFGEGSLLHFSPVQVVCMDLINVFVGIRLALLKDHPFSFSAFFK